MKIYTLILMTLITSCGAEDQGSEPAADSGQRSLYLNTEADLPQCNDESENWLAYIKADELFKACQGGQWVTVDVVGPKGEQGIAGEAGEPGTDAVASDIGDQWTDPATGQIWTPLSTSETYDDAVALCASEGMILPAVAYHYKVIHFFFTFFSEQPIGTKYWTSVVTGSGHQTREIDNVSATADESDANENLVFCTTP